MASPMAFSPQLMDQLVFYGQYHNNPVWYMHDFSFHIALCFTDLR